VRAGGNVGGMSFFGPERSRFRLAKLGKWSAWWLIICDNKININKLKLGGLQ
jgi:hypothetical protein